MFVRSFVTLTIASALPTPLLAHAAGDGFSLWYLDPTTGVLMLLLALVYWRGSRANTASSGIQQRRKYYFWTGWILLALALGPPVDPMGEVLFSVHMIQHEVMMLGAAPLLVLSQPSANLLNGVPRQIAIAVGTIIRRTGGAGWIAWISSPLPAWTIHAIGLWAWHIPALFNAGLQSSAIHTLQHVSFLLIALLFWFALLKPKQQAPAANVIYLFTTGLHASLLGALLTFSSRIWYAPYESTAPQWGLSALEDQQLGGLIMWMPAGVVFLAAGLVAMATLLRSGERGVKRSVT